MNKYFLKNRRNIVVGLIIVSICLIIYAAMNTIGINSYDECVRNGGDIA